MKRVVILGRGASGKSILARQLGAIIGLPVIELDNLFWSSKLEATSRDEWIATQEKLTAGEGWILDGDLGPYDAVEARLSAADTVLFLDFSFICCAWRALRRSRERADFWRWVLLYRWQSRPILMRAVAEYASQAKLHVFHDPATLSRFVEGLKREFSSTAQ